MSLPETELMSLKVLMAKWRPGSKDERPDGQPWTWDDEVPEMLWGEDHLTYSEWLSGEIIENGITEPIILGHDGRVWDGHHRIAICTLLGIEWVPVDVVPAPEEVDA